MIKISAQYTAIITHLVDPTKTFRWSPYLFVRILFHAYWKIMPRCSVYGASIRLLIWASKCLCLVTSHVTITKIVISTILCNRCTQLRNTNSDEPIHIEASPRFCVQIPVADHVGWLWLALADRLP